MNTTRIGAALLVPAAAIFSLRALFALVGHDVPRALGPITGAAGVLSLVGMVFVVAGLGLAAVAGAAFILIGHFVVADASPDLGAGLVYLGTGMLVALRAPRAAAAGALAMAGALLRSGTIGGHAMVAGGAAWLALELVRVSRDMDVPE